MPSIYPKEGLVSTTNRILWINPIGSSDFDKPIKEFLEMGKNMDTETNVVSLSRGPSTWNITATKPWFLLIPYI